MKFLMDKHQAWGDQMLARFPDLVLGQLLTPITDMRRWSWGPVAVDNGSYSGFQEAKFLAMINKHCEDPNLLWVALPDVVGDHKKTRALWEDWSESLPGLPKAFVAQDGCESIPSDSEAVFIGGTTAWKMGDSASKLVRSAVRSGRWVHVGRVNTPGRYLHFKALGADTCDGTGILKYPRMILDIAKASRRQPFWKRI